MNTKVVKVFYNNELELNIAIENNIIEGMAVYKLVQIIPITEKSAYLVFENDPDKTRVNFIQSKKTEHSGSYIPFDSVIMSFSEIELLKAFEEIEIAEEPYEILQVQMLFNEQGERSIFVTVKNLFDDVLEYQCKIGLKEID